MVAEQQTLPKDWRHFIPASPSVITEDSWQVRNALADRYYPQIFDLLRFGEDHLVEILIDVEQNSKPDAWRGVAYPGAPRPLAYLPRRSHLEWHLFRGVAPIARRPAISPSLRSRVIARDGLVCQLCGRAVELDDVHLDHIKPFSLGGPTTLSNLQVAHSRCNMSKGARV